MVRRNETSSPPTRRLLAVLLVLAFSALPGAAPAQEIRAVDSVAITVDDLDDALAFYTGVLPFEPVEEVELAGPAYERLFGVFGLRLRVARLRLGEEEIELVDFLAPDTGRPFPPDMQSNDHWFQHVALIVNDMDAAYAHLRAHNVQHASAGPQVLPDWNPAAGGIAAFYFRDPDGNHLELLEFPPNLGAARWHEPTDRLFLGIDHTAIVVADTADSLGFWQDTLGFAVAGTAENYGPEQERLNNVFGARLAITGLTVGAGPAVEFLEYLAPDTGRPYPVDSRANDLWHWHITLETDDVAAAADAVRQAGYQWVSPGPVDLPDGALGWHRGLLARDPTGHAVLLVEE